MLLNFHHYLFLFYIMWFLFFLLVLYSNLANITNLCCWMSRISYLLSQSFHYCHLGLVLGPPHFYASHTYIWAAGVLLLFMSSPQALVFHPEMVLLTAHAICLNKCWGLSLHEICTTVLTDFYYVISFSLWVTVWQLSCFAYPIVYGQRFLWYFMTSNAYSAFLLPHFKPILVSSHCLLLAYHFRLLVLLWFLHYPYHLWIVLLGFHLLL